ncbi:HET-domain-containing protein, partial [Stipitochalara longipes BDJ]
NEIPKTFQDAIKVICRLEIKYLWIDSFCIVQDDILEWQTEAAKMADIYGSSGVGIAACQADNCSTGFL